MKGAFWALCSVLLVSAAQLLLRSAMQSLPPVSDVLALISALWHFSSGTGALLLGLMGYVASMGCWYLALHRMALSKAYALLSLSYILVWGAAILLPGWEERFSWHGLVGVGFIILGVLTIFRPARRQQNGSARP
ncbi:MULTISPECIES: 4-amino-4-deoxy-L-arabinose-phosphoundecaprenol flippase subunit ArnF [Enterobacter]|uniref:4-amino-4-deoxy-L-arabinose-phosphoundecaprenol flippase subunit ArnF n=1 Tax=Enterobacter TaxID=547 RepID=UPI000F819C20|nr:MULTISPECIES: 4-amino-4-deoxy-L-arabinose-phosphoundecaprenol flippase subunit ArnF [Enterobacter]MCB5949869.1 4-amino-4-deoxy-L-arabinose-phospho-UDP flippase [Enterobacter sp. TCD1-1]MCM7533229.1 4-amino-4-deoxy-L-arabinose-phosphoundecaprenol flippase subunit ArnF [Enterobacter quasiroggenkampii]MCU6349312.1 4-amino-4-deoxy-L-arabinose-phospho-UDP flippase [Enterobacter quasiroggenkampii]MEB6579337.1 4-amino-4-deoxy-L-arabinose-phosphoundecaprenol flippase subunit ArnF [Enterobacter quasi